MHLGALLIERSYFTTDLLHFSFILFSFLFLFFFFYTGTTLKYHGPVFQELARCLHAEDPRKVDRFCRVLSSSASHGMQLLLQEIIDMILPGRFRDALAVEGFLRIWGYETMASKEKLREALREAHCEHIFHIVENFSEGKDV